MSQLKPNPGANKRKMRVGRGTSSGKGKTSGRGGKGQTARKSGTIPARFEGGQWPLYRRLPKRGFTNIFQESYAPVNLGDLAVKIKGNALADIDIEALKKLGLVAKSMQSVKLLATVHKNVQGELSHLKGKVLKVHKASQAAVAVAEKAGAKVELVTIETKAG